MGSEVYVIDTVRSCRTQRYRVTAKGFAFPVKFKNTVRGYAPPFFEA